MSNEFPRGSAQEAFGKFSAAEGKFEGELRKAATAAGKEYAEIRDAVARSMTSASSETEPETVTDFSELLRANPELRSAYDALVEAEKEYDALPRTGTEQPSE